MSALSIQPTYPIFTETDGQPLEDGYIWIGTANLDPQVNPINVYWDAALTIAAPQPIRTINGYPSRNGTPGRLYVNSDYSIRVMNKNGSIVYSAQSATERYSGVVINGINAEDVIYDPPFTSAVQTNVEAKLAQVISVKDFGAAGDGVTDDYDAIQAAVAAINAQGGGTLVFPYGTYFINHYVQEGPSSNGITDFLFDQCDGLVIDGQGSTIKLLGGWVMTNDYTSGGFNFSYKRQINIRVYRSSNVTIQNLKLDGGGATITKGAGLTGENQSYGFQFASGYQVTLLNVQAQYYCTDGLYIDKYLNDSISTGFNVIGCKFNNNARQGVSIIQLRNAVFTQCEFTQTGFCGAYGFWSPAAGVDVEPNLAPPSVTDYTGDLVFIGCNFTDNVGFEFVSTGPDKVLYPIDFFGCLFRSTAVSTTTPQVACGSKLNRFWSCDFDQEGIWPNYSASKTVDSRTELRGCNFNSFTTNPNSAPIVLYDFGTGCVTSLLIDSCRFTFSGTVPQTQLRLQINADTVEFTNNYVFVSNGLADFAVDPWEYFASLTNAKKSIGNQWVTDLTTAGKCFSINFGGATVVNDTLTPPAHISPNTSGYFKTNYAVGIFAFQYLETPNGGKITSGGAAPTTGTWVQGDIVFNSSPIAGGTPGWVCTTGGTPGTWKAMANVAA